MKWLFKMKNIFHKKIGIQITTNGDAGGWLNFSNIVNNIRIHIYFTYYFLALVSYFLDYWEEKVIIM